MGAKRNKVGFAVAGCGRQAWLGYFPWIAENPGAELVAVADIDAEIAEKAAKKFGARKIYRDCAEMVEKSGAAALCVTTPPWAHADPAIAAAEKGMHVFPAAPPQCSQR